MNSQHGTQTVNSSNYYQVWSNQPPPPSPAPSRRTNYSLTRTLSRTLSQRVLFKTLPKMVVCRVILLDEENFQVEIAKNALGNVLFEIVKEKLSLNEADYFSLSFRNSQNVRFWLNLDKRIDKQVESSKDMVFYWEVKFYPPSPDQLNEDLTQYLIVLQIRQDIRSGRLPASFQTLAVLGSYTAQGEIGDFDKIRHIDIEYLRPYSFAPNQSEELLMRICSLHKTCKGLTPAEADRYFLQNASKCALYGMDTYKVKDSANKEVKIGVCASGLYIYNGRLRMESFKWPRMLKISYKTNVFHIKVRPAEFEHLQKTLGFKLPTPKLAKRLWKVAVENHQFFRLKQPEFTDTGSLRGFGNRRWRMSGRTQAQLRNIGTPTRTYSRSNSITPSDMYSGFTPPSMSTMPVPTRRVTGDRVPDVNKNYNTFNEGAARMLVPSASDEIGSAPAADDPDEGHRGTDKLVDLSYDNAGEYIPGGSVHDSGMPRGGNTGSQRKIPTGDPRDPVSSENLVNGDHERQSESDILPIQTGTSYRAPNGQLRRPLPKERQPNGAGQTADGSSRSSPEPVEENVVRAAGGATQPSFSNMNTQPSTEKVHPKTPPKSTSTRYPSSSSQQSTGTFGVGELPMPRFCLESAGVMPTGKVDSSIKLDVSERAEKIIKVGMPPTVKTTRMKFSEGSTEPDTRATWSPPTVQTEKSHFNYVQNPKPDLNGYRNSNAKPITSGGHERISETTTFMMERDGYTEKKVKHTITISGDDDLDNQLLLDAIQMVTGLDSTLGVDRIEIKTESECD